MGIIDVPELLPGFIVETPETVVTLAISGESTSFLSWHCKHNN